MAMMKYGTAVKASVASQQAWGNVKSASSSREEEEELRKKTASTKK